MRIALFLLLSIFIFTGCSTKVEIKSLQPAKAQGLSSYKTISVLPFKKDSVSLEKNIESDLINYYIDGKNYFTVVEADKSKIYDEHTYRESGIYGSELADDFEDLKGAKAFITGAILLKEVSDSSSREERESCADKKCKKKKKYYVRCTTRDAKLESLIKIIDIKTAKIIFSKVYERGGSWNKCSDEMTPLPGRFTILYEFAEEISQEFVNEITPSYVYMKVPLLDDPDIDYSSREKKLLKSAIKNIEEAKFEKAEVELLELVKKTKRKCYVAIYNLGVLKEQKGLYKDALAAYRNANVLTKEKIEEIEKAIKRVKRLQREREEAMREINSQ